MNEGMLDYLADGAAQGYAGLSLDSEKITNIVKGSATAQRDADERLEKAITSGGAVQSQPGDTSFRATREEFILQSLTHEHYTAEKCVAFNRLKKIKVDSNLVQFVSQTDLGGGGDGFIAETGGQSSSAFGYDVTSDADFKRESESTSLIYDVREVGSVAQKVKGLVDPVPNAHRSAIVRIKVLSNRALLYSDKKTNNLGFNGYRAQILQGVRDNPQARGYVLFDAGGKAFNNAWFNYLFATMWQNNFSRPTVALMSGLDLYNFQNTLLPITRAPQVIDGTVGTDVDKIKNPFSPERSMELVADPMIRGNMPLNMIGVGANGKPRDENTVDANALAFAATPWTSGTAGSAGTAYFYQNVTLNTDAAAIGGSGATTPAVPATTDGGDNANRLNAGTYFYAVSCVYLGRESRLWILGNTSLASSGSLGTGTTTTVTVTAGQVVKLTIDLTSITGLGTTYKRELIRWRIYRAPATATKVSDFDLLCECGTPTAGNTTVAVDNGMYIPGGRDAFLLNENDDEDGAIIFFAQLAEVYKRPLPNTLLSDLCGFLNFGTPVVRKRTALPQHLWVRNLGDTTR